MNSRARIVAAALAAALYVPLHAPASSAVRIHPNLEAVLAKSTGAVGVIVTFRSAPTQADARSMLAAGFQSGLVRYTIVPAVYGVGTERAIRRIAASERVVMIEYDEKIPLALDPATSAGRAKPLWDATFRSQGQTKVGGITGRGIGIAIVDSGVDATHPDLAWGPLAETAGIPPKTVANFKMLGRDSAEIADGFGIGEFAEAATLAVNMPDTDNTGGHGTHVAGIAAGNGSSSDGKYTGVAPGANLIGFGAGEVLVVHLGLAAFDWIHQHHQEFNIRVINNSWGGAGEWDPELAVTKAVRRLVNEDGIVVVFAAGNSGGSGESLRTSVWGNIPEVIQVANYYDGSGWLDNSSSRGLKSREDTWPDLAAPGTQILSAQSTGKPVTVVGSGQDALLNEAFRYGEPNVIPAPLPSPLETEVAGHRFMAGNYASFTGTSMSSPFVAGVVALMLEANPKLKPHQVREILRETANMPRGRSYRQDGFAVGKGVVDAAEAVAVALSLGDGRSFEQALQTSYMDTAKSPLQINLRSPRSATIDPVGQSHNDGRIRVTGSFHAGPVTDDSIPLSPNAEVSLVSGSAIIFHGGLLGVGGGGVVFPGESVALAVESISSRGPRLADGNFEGEHRVLRHGSLAYGPFDAEEDRTNGGFRTSSSWEIPIDAPPGTYVFEGYVTLKETGDRYLTDSIEFAVGLHDSAPRGAARLKPPSASTELSYSMIMFEDDFEDSSAWEIRQEGFGPGLLTQWSLVDERSLLTFNGTHSGNRAFYAGHYPGAPYLSGLYYEDFADTSLVSPPIDLSGLSSATVTYWRTGWSEMGYDFLRLLAAPAGTEDWLELENASGNFLDSGNTGGWTEGRVSVPPRLLGSPIRLRFQFVSDELSDTPNLVGWYIDDVKVEGVSGVPGLDAPVLHATLTEGIGALETWLTVSSESPADRFELDFGDGSPPFVTTQTATVKHTYPAGQWASRLTAFAGGASATTTLSIDVAGSNRIELRIPGGTWVDAGPALSQDKTFSADLVFPHTGESEVELRHCDPTRRCIRQRAEVRASSAPPPPPRPRSTKVKGVVIQPQTPPDDPALPAPVQERPEALPEVEVKGTQGSRPAAAVALITILIVGGALLNMRMRWFPIPKR